MATCPACGSSSRTDPEAISVKNVLRPTKLALESIRAPELISETEMEITCVEELRLICRCGWSIAGRIELDGHEYAFFGNPSTQVWPVSGE